MEIKLTQEVRETLLSYGNSSPTYEVCGALLGKKANKVWKCDEFIPLTNVSDKSKEVHYIPDPNEFFNVIKTTTHMSKKNKKDLVGVFHTHPNSMPVPSITDIDGAGYEGIYIIHSPKYDEMRAYYYDGIVRKFNPSKIVEV